MLWSQPEVAHHCPCGYDRAMHRYGPLGPLCATGETPAKGSFRADDRGSVKPLLIITLAFLYMWAGAALATWISGVPG